MKLPETFETLFDCSEFGLRDLLPPTVDPVWDRQFMRQQKYVVHRQTRSILFKWLENTWRPGEPLEIQDQNYAGEELYQAVLACSHRLEQHFSGKAVKLMLAELCPGGEILPHIDQGAALTLSHRCHIPLMTNDSVEFWIDNRPHRFREDVAFELDNTRLHSVVNRSQTSRIHLICDVLEPRFWG